MPAQAIAPYKGFTDLSSIFDSCRSCPRAEMTNSFSFMAMHREGPKIARQNAQEANMEKTKKPPATAKRFITAYLSRKDRNNNASLAPVAKLSGCRMLDLPFIAVWLQLQILIKVLKSWEGRFAQEVLRAYPSPNSKGQF